MMQALVLALGVSCLVHQAIAVVDPVDCPGRPSSRCDAVAGLVVRVVGEGSCRGVASADCKVWTESQNEISDNFALWYASPDKLCDKGFVSARARAVARAIAKIFANSFVKVTCTGTGGFACGLSFAGGEGFANSVAEALAFAAADASVKVGNDVVNGFCFADFRAVGAAFVSASASASSQTCTTGGTAVAWENNFATAIDEVIATAFASASASRCVEPGDTSATSECFGDAKVTRNSIFLGRGDFCVDAGGLEACDGPGKELCCNSDIPICFSRAPCPGCFLPWNRSPDAAKTNVWTKANGSQCFC